MMPFMYVAVTVSIVRIPQGVLGLVSSWTYSSGEGGLPMPIFSSSESDLRAVLKNQTRVQNQHVWVAGCVGAAPTWWTYVHLRFGAHLLPSPLLM